MIPHIVHAQVQGPDIFGQNMMNMIPHIVHDQVQGLDISWRNMMNMIPHFVHEQVQGPDTFGQNMMNMITHIVHEQFQGLDISWRNMTPHCTWAGPGSTYPYTVYIWAEYDSTFCTRADSWSGPTGRNMDSAVV
jgi:hypothetical protein